MAIMAISVAPAGLEGASMSDYVARALDVLKDEERVTWELGPMFTTVEGELDVLFDVARRMHKAIADAGAPRVGTVIKIDDRYDKDLHMQEKMSSARSKMNR